MLEQRWSDFLALEIRDSYFGRAMDALSTFPPRRVALGGITLQMFMVIRASWGKHTKKTHISFCEDSLIPLGRRPPTDEYHKGPFGQSRSGAEGSEQPDLG